MDGSPELTLIEPDERGRISLARLPGQNAARYAGRRLDDGTIVLEPVVVLPVRALDSLRVALTSSSARKPGRSGTTPLGEVLDRQRWAAGPTRRLSPSGSAERRVRATGNPTVLTSSVGFPQRSQRNSGQAIA